MNTNFAHTLLEGVVKLLFGFMCLGLASMTVGKTSIAAPILGIGLSVLGFYLVLQSLVIGYQLWEEARTLKTPVEHRSKLESLLHRRKSMF